jgi:hypothetical protein
MAFANENDVIHNITLYSFTISLIQEYDTSETVVLSTQVLIHGISGLEVMLDVYVRNGARARRAQFTARYKLNTSRQSSSRL